MYLAALHVVVPSTGFEGFNAFHYMHPDGAAWDLAPREGVPDQDPGVLVNTRIEIPPPGNRLRSYLDVVAPDNALWLDIRNAFLWFVLDCEGQPFPWQRSRYQFWFRASMDQAAAANWRSELGMLYEKARLVRLPDVSLTGAPKASDD